MNTALVAAIASAVFATFFAFHCHLLRSLSRSRLAGVVEDAQRTGRVDWIDNNYREVCLSTYFLWALGNISLITSLMCFYCQETVGVIEVLESVLVAAGVIAVFGVAIPYACAENAGKKVLPITFPIMFAFTYACYPFTLIMIVVENITKRLMGWDNQGKDNTEDVMDEIIHAVEDGRVDGAVNASEVKMIESIMELDSVDTAEIMTPRTDVVALEIGTLFNEVISEIRMAGHSRVPVYKDSMDNVIGIIYAKDLLGITPDNDTDGVAPLLREPFFVPETKTIESLLREFKLRQVHLAIVLDEYGGTAGIVTIEDILEEIVGEITDEYDKADLPMVTRINDTTLEVDGRLRVDEINDLLSISLPLEEGFDTIAGYVIYWFGYIPVKGESFSSHGAEFQVLKADERRIHSLHIKLLEKEGEE